jgi:glycosyltransferase involved in cell wall biosynthesis
MSPRVAYWVSRFPKTSETFIVDEVVALEGAGVEVVLHALAAGRGAAVGADAARLDARCRRLAPFSPRLLVAQAQWLLRAPGRLLGVWGRVLARHARAPRDLARAVVAVAHAVAHSAAMQREGIAHVHAHWATHTTLAAWTVHRLTGLPYSFTAHADDLFVERPMLDEKVAEAAFVVTISDYNRTWLRQRLREATDTPIEVVRCGVDADAFAPAPAPAPDRETPFTVVCVARLEPKKGHADLLAACARLVERGVDLRCVLIGEGSRRPALEALARRLGLGDRVAWRGARPREDVRAALAEAHVVALASVVDADGRADGIPVALMEAMAMARPVVATRVTGIPELVEDEVGGLLVAPGDAEALATAIDRVRSEPGLATRLGAAARARVVETYDLHGNVARLRDLFAAHGRAPEEAGRVASAVPSRASGEL